MNRLVGCDKCHGTRPHRGADGEVVRIPAHKRDCPEMSFTSGRRRDDPGPSAPLRPCDPDRKFPLHQESPIGEEMARIFSGLAEKRLQAYIAEQRALHAADPR